MTSIRRLFKRLKRFFMKDKTPAWIYSEIEKRQNQAALRDFLARRGICKEKQIAVPTLKKVENKDANTPWRVTMGNLYPDLSEFQ